jgi:septal ring factor EnvC (AmiA/AmiB activator)
MSEYWTEKDVMENAILDLQHERDDLQAELARKDEIIQKLTLDRDGMADENRMLSERVQRVVDGVKGRDEKIDELRNNITAYRRTVISQKEVIAKLLEAGQAMYSAVGDEELRGTREFCDWLALMEELEEER